MSNTRPLQAVDNTVDTRDTRDTKDTVSTSDNMAIRNLKETRIVLQKIFFFVFIKVIFIFFK